MTGTLAVSLGPLEQIPLGEGRAFDVQGRQVAVFRLRNGQLHAVSAVCPHRGGPLADGQVDGTIVLCPLHLNAFRLADGCSTTGQPALDVWSVTVDDAGAIVVSAEPVAPSAP
jgi:nitrite reductase (NADH) small subunit